MALIGTSYKAIDSRIFMHPGPVVDIGCLMWNWSGWMADLGKRVHGYDFNEAKTHANATLFRCAVTSDGRPVNIYGDGQAASIGCGNSVEKAGASAPSKTLEAVLDACGMEPSMLKMNIEGAEYELLEHVNGPIADQLAIAFHDRKGFSYTPGQSAAVRERLGKWYDWTETYPNCSWWLGVRKSAPLITTSPEAVGMLWIGDKLDRIARECMLSHLAVGHAVTLYTYGSVDDIPHGVTRANGREMLDMDPVAYQSGNGKGSFALFSDLFRYAMLYRRGGWWSDTDAYAIRRWTAGTDKPVAAYVGPDCPNCLGAGAIWSPAGSPVMLEAFDAALSAVAENRYQKWGDIGPRLLTRIATASAGRAAMLPAAVFYPAGPKNGAKELSSGIITGVTPRTESVHLYGEMWRRGRLDPDKATALWSRLAELRGGTSEKIGAEPAGKTAGILLLAFGKPYDALAAAAALRSRACTGLPMHVLTNLAADERAADWGRITDITFKYMDLPCDDNRAVKTAMYAYTPFDTTVYIDCDAVVQRAGLDTLIELAQDHDIAVVQAAAYKSARTAWSLYSEQARILKASFPMAVPAGGFIIFKRNEKMRALFETWHENWNATGKGRDMPSLAAAFQRHKPDALWLPKHCFEWHEDKQAVIQHRWGDGLEFCARFNLPAYIPNKPFDAANFGAARRAEDLKPATSQSLSKPASGPVTATTPVYITAVIKTFERPAVCKRLVDSVRRFYPAMPVIVADDGRQEFVTDDPLTRVIRLPYDSGLSAGRNALVDAATTEFVLLLDDDYVFTDATNIAKLLRIMQRRTEIDILAGTGHDNTTPAGRTWKWYGNIRKDINGFTKLAVCARPDKDGVILCDFVPNFFLARTERLKLVRWDADLKMAEHMDFFARAQGVLVSGICPSVVVEHIRTSTPSYTAARARDRRFNNIMRTKHGFPVRGAGAAV